MLSSPKMVRNFIEDECGNSIRIPIVCKHFTAPEARQTHRSCLVHLDPCNAGLLGPSPYLLCPMSWLGGSAVLVRSDPSRDGSPIRRKASNLELSAQVSAKQDVTDQLPNGWGGREQAAPCCVNVAGPWAAPRLRPSYRMLRPKWRPWSAKAALHA
jgi:hypothetical protein